MAQILEIVHELLKPRTIFALMFYSSCIYLVANDKLQPEIIQNAVMVLLGFYFGRNKEKI